jgi:hypothetical protein
VPREGTLTIARNPAPAGDVGDGAPVADQVAGGGLFELSVEAFVKAPGFVPVSVYAVGDLFRGVAFSRGQTLGGLFTLDPNRGQYGNSR